MPPNKPFSPETLAERWGCSPEKIRRMYHDGELSGFRLGKLIRIPANEVERFECQTDTGSESTEESSASSTMTRSEVALESRLERLTVVKPKLSPVTSGASSMPRQRIG